ncbi:tetratricopeptide repeat protein [Singulisphaera sp. Ch08]|uniref:Tetratricopeptide repeat protein n=1 Tax=Singulisphaera sp. Ch08 TaxID=3120278 RepID=A0AAU7CD85_9BACT
MSDRTSKPKRLNLRAWLISAAVVAFALTAVFLVKRAEVGRIRQKALAEVRALLKSDKPDLAIRHLEQYLAMAPDDVEALEIQADVAFKAAASLPELLHAARIDDRLLRLDPHGPGRGKSRRRLVEIYVRYSDAFRATDLFLNAPELMAKELRYRAAVVIARDVVVAAPNDPVSHRLLGMALEGLAASGDEPTLDAATKEYETALSLDPKELESAERLARLHQERRHDPASAERVLGALLAAAPDSAEARLVRYRYFDRIRNLDRAAVEIEAATRLAANNLEVRLTAARDALQRGDTTAARAQIDRIAAADRDDERVRVLRVMVNFGEERPQEAIEEWRRGLIATHGTSAEMSWWLAYSLLRLGRVSDAVPLIDQYLRLTGNPKEARLSLLKALRAEASGRPDEGVKILEEIEPKVAGPLREKLYLATGRCYQALGDSARALRSFRQAARISPTGSVVARLTAANAVIDTDLQEAIDEINRGLSQAPGQPDLLVALAGAHLRLQASQPAERRNWSDFDRAQAQAARALPNSASVVLLQADRLAVDGQLDRAVALLETSAGHAPHDVRVVAAWAEGLHRLGRTSDALKILEQAAAPNAIGDGAVLRLARARLLLASARGGEARAMLGRDLDRLPPVQRAVVLEARGLLAASQGDAVTARQAFDAWANLRPNEPQPLIASLKLAVVLGDELAIRAALTALEKCGGDDIAYLTAKAFVLLQARGDQLESAARVIGQVLEKAPELPTAHLLQGQLFERQNRLDDALTAYRRALKGGADFALPRLASLLARTNQYEQLLSLQQAERTSQIGGLAAHASWQAGDRDQAARFAALAVKAQPEGVDAKRWQARMLDSLGRVEEAEAALRTNVERHPDQIDPWMALIRYQLNHGRPDAARRSADAVRRNIKTDRPAVLEALCRSALGDLAGADRSFEAALRDWPDDSKVHITAAGYFEHSDRHARSIELLQRAHRLDPKNRKIVLQLALQLSERAASEPSAWGQAWSFVGPATGRVDTPEDRLTRAIVLSRHPEAAQRSEAIQAFNDLLADLPPDHTIAAAARPYLVNSLRSAGQLDRAIEVAASAVGLDASVNAISLYVESLIHAGRFAPAEAQLDRLVLLNPMDTRSAKLRVDLIRLQAGPENAPDALERAVRARDRSPDSERFGREAFAAILAADSPSLGAADRVGRMLAGRNPALTWMSALVAVRQGRLAEAIGSVETAAKVATGNDLNQVGQVAVQAATAPNADDATRDRLAKIVEFALGRSPDNHALILASALLLHQQGRYAEEIAAYRKLLASKPEANSIRNNLAWALSEGHGRPEEALAMIDELVRRAPGNSAYLATRGVILIRLKRFEQAVADLETAVRVGPTALRQFHLARAYHASGQESKFREAMDQARLSGLSLKMSDPTERDLMARFLRASSP